MKLHITSDLHLDHRKNFSEDFIEKFDSTSIDALIVAGDLSDNDQKARAVGARTNSVKILCQKYPLVFMVMGNHDYYGSSFEDVKERNLEWMDMFGNLIILDNGENYIHKESGLKIAGGTMWYPNNNEVQQNKGYWPDFRLIHGDAESHIFKSNNDFRDSLNSLKPENYPDIVITHMLPTPLATHKDFKDSDCNCYFVSDETELINKIQPKIWIFGHTHHIFDFNIKKTRMYCNPRAYVNEDKHNNPNFLKRMEINVT